MQEIKRGEGGAPKSAAVCPHLFLFALLAESAKAVADARHADECCHSSALRARSPLGAPPRYSPRKSMPRLSFGPRFLGRARGRTVCCPSPAEAPRRPVI